MGESREKTACFTGRRELSLFQIPFIKRKLKKALEELIENGYLYFGAGGALGFDTLAAQAVLELRKKYSQIKLILVLPCKTQADRWPEADKEEYESIKNQADKVVYTSEEYTRDCMFKRNRHLVDYSSICICYLNKDSGGTAYTVNYARSRGLEIINIAD
jgi:uncharacterized phage-like protein YoqJ